MKPSLEQIHAVLTVARIEIRLLGFSTEIEMEALEYCADSYRKGWHSGWRSIREAVDKAKQLDKAEKLKVAQAKNVHPLWV